MSSSPKKLENDSLVNDVHKTSIAVAKQEKPDNSKKNEATASGTKDESATRRGRTMAKAAISGGKAVNSKTSTQPTSDTTDRDVKQCARVMVKATVPGAVKSTSGSISKKVVTGGAPKVSSHLAASYMMPPSEPSMTPEITNRKQGQKEIATSSTSDRDAKQCGRAKVKATVPGTVGMASGSVSKQVATGRAPKASSHLVESLMEPPYESSMKLETTERYQGQNELLMIQHWKSQVEILEEEKMRFLDTIAALNEKIMDADEASTCGSPSAVLETTPRKLSSDRNAKQCGRAMVKASVPGAVASASGSGSKQVVMGGAPTVSSHLDASLMEPPYEPSITLETTARYQGQKEVVTLASSDRDAKQWGRAMVKAIIPGAVASTPGSVSEQFAMGGAPKVSSHLVASLIGPPSESYMTPETTARYQGQKEVVTLASSDRDAKQCGRAMVKATVPGAVASASGSGSKQVVMGGAPKVSSHLLASLMEPPYESSMTAQTTAHYQGQKKVAILSTSDRNAKQCGRVMVKATVPGAVESTSGSVSKQVAKGGAPKVSSHLLASLMEPPSEPSVTLETTARYQGQKEVATLSSSDRDAKQCGRAMVKAIIPGAVASTPGSVSEQFAMGGAPKVSNHLVASLIEPPSEPYMAAETTARYQGQEEVATLSSSDRGAKQRERAMAKASGPASAVVHEGARNPGAVSVEPSFLTEPSSESFSQSSSSIDFCDNNEIVGDATMDPTFAANESVGPTVLEAIKVEDEYIPEAMAVSEEEINKKGRRRCMIFLCFLVMTVVVSVTIAVKISKKDDNNIQAPTEVPSMSPFPTTIVFDRLEMLVPTYSIENTGIESSAQSKALLWLETSQTSNTPDWTDKMLLEKFAAATLYYSTDGGKWANNENWLSDNDICADRHARWKGFTCDRNNLTLSLESNRLVGELPAEISLFTDLKSIYLSDNVIQETIPSELGLMDGLVQIYLDGNNLRGQIPIEIGHMTTMKRLDLSDNSLSGRIPSSVGLLSDLELLDVADNNFVGSIPSEIGLLSNLTALFLNENSFWGKIPAELGMNLQLKTLDLVGNQLTGTIPFTDDSDATNSMQLRFRELQVLSLSDNILSGTIPTEISLFGKLEIFDVRGNTLLAGSIPSEMGALVGLRELDLSGTDLNGTLPTEIGALWRLQELLLSGNEFSGPIPSQVGLLPKVSKIDMSLNDLSGQLPSEIGELSSLQTLDLSGNDLTGTLPTELGNLTELSSLSFIYNYNLGGPIPSELGWLASLEQIYVTNTNVTGIIGGMPSIPPSSSPTTDVRGRLEMLVPTHSIENLGIENSAQSEALLWLEMNQTSNTADWTDKVLLEKFAAATLYYSTDGDEWTNIGNWLSDNDICAVRKDAWRGFRCDVNNITFQLQLSSNRLVGELPAEISLFTDLKSIYLSDNVIQETIPSELGLMDGLVQIYLDGNNLRGQIPIEIGHMKSLRVINLSDNSLSGSIPSSVGLLSDLERLDVADNSLVGSIASEIGLLSNLTTLSLKENSFLGEIPSELGMNLKLKYLELEGNKLAGTIPFTDNFNATNTTEVMFGQLRILTLADNSLTGTIPTEIGLLDNLEIFDVRGNGLITGRIPSEIGVLVGLRQLLISGNDLSGPIPSEIGLLHKLPILNVEELSLTGSLPTEIGMMESLEYLLAKENSLTGRIPSEIGQLTELGVLSLARNAFTGVVPSQLSFLKILKEMDLKVNNLSGQLPIEIGFLQSLETLEMNNNKFSGIIPTEIGLASDLQSVNLDSNDLSGTIPTEFGLLERLQYLSLNYNSGISGTLPTEIGLLTSLETLWFYGGVLSGALPSEIGLSLRLENLGIEAIGSDKKLTGQLPSEIGQLSSLQLLDLTGNDLTGTLPPELGSLAELSSLSVIYNANLGGVIPSELGLLTSLRFLYVVGTNVTGDIPMELCPLLEDKLNQCYFGVSFADEVQCSC